MRVGIIGRTKALIDSAKLLEHAGHEIAFIYTCKDEEYYKFSTQDFFNYASAKNIPYYNDLRINQNSAQLINHRAEVCISVNWMTILGQVLINAFPYGILNAHGGDLPRYRGNACINWAIINHESTACMSVHQMSAELDAGPIYAKRYFALTKDTYAKDFYDWGDNVIPEMFLEAITLIENGQSPTPQDEAVRPYRCFPRKPQDSRINWDCDLIDIHALVRASSHPLPGAFCFTEDGSKLRIYKSLLVPADFDFCAIPGQVCLLKDGIPLIAGTNNNLLLGLLDVSLDALNHSESVKEITSSLRNRLI